MKLSLSDKIRFDRNEFSGAFGDIGTDLPLIIGMILAAGLDSASVLIMFGLLQVFTAFVYGLPMPLQPLKAVALIVIAQNISPGVLYGGGLAIGIIMMVLTITGLVNYLSTFIPKVVIRGIQLGLGLQLANIAINQYITPASTSGYILAAFAFILTFFLMGNRKYPPALIIIISGIFYGYLFNVPLEKPFQVGFSMPEVQSLSHVDIWTGFLILALPQIPLSLGNSILATNQVLKDYFPEKKVGIKKISLTYSFINLVLPWFGGIPACHGSGGLVGHYSFGARTGGSLIIYGSFYLIAGFFFSTSFENFLQVFPLPILGVILLFEALYLMILIKDVTFHHDDLILTVLTGLMASLLPYGFLIAFVVGTILYYIKKHLLKPIGRDQ